VFRNEQGWAVFAVDGTRARLRSVQLGPRSGEQALVEAGLQPGERVIVFPSDAVRDGARVSAREPAARR
jgi:HlyD family secretion protein